MINKTIEKIKKDLLVTHNEINLWFIKDRDLIYYFPKKGWSIYQILEHITLTNHYLLILIRKGKRKALDAALKNNKLIETLESYSYNLDELDLIAKHKSFTWIRPDHMEPTGKPSLEEVSKILSQQIEECLTILEEIPNGEGLLYKTAMSVNNLGKIDVYQYIYFLCLHSKRHIDQMKNIENEFVS